jgi:phage-related tail fiber protein
MPRTSLTKKQLRAPWDKTKLAALYTKLAEHDTDLDTLDGTSFAGGFERATCRIATTAAVTLASVGLATIDGVALSDNDRVLVWKQSSGAENGIYNAHATAWTRATDANTSAKVTSGISARISDGTLYGGCLGLLTTTGTIVLGSTSLTFTVSRPVDSTGVTAKAVAVSAAGNTVPIVPVQYVVTVTNGTADQTLTCDATSGAITITSVEFTKTGVTGSTSDAVILNDASANAISNSFALSGVAAGTKVSNTFVSQTYNVIAAGTVLHVAKTQTTNNAGVMVIRGYRSA